MNNMDENTISQVLMIVLGVAIVVLAILCVIFVILKMRENKSKKKQGEEKITDTNNSKKKSTVGTSQIYNKQSILDFMEFDGVQDNMIIQKNGRRYLMVVECQGVNYDLMSNVEKVGVEEGFQQFLNTLRHPIQIYIQTRTINLENSISNYKSRVRDIENRYNQMNMQFNRMREEGIYTEQELREYYFELTKQRNLLEYGKDIVANTEKMSLNKNILNKKYYVVIPYFSEEAINENEKYDKEEIRNMAFSELYTKSQSIIRTLSSCSISGKILSSKELIELLYVAYNRDESEVFGIDKAIRAGYDNLYSTAPDVYEKKVAALDKMINDRAIDLANETIERVKSRPEQIAKEKEKNLDELVRRMAAIVIDENRRYVGQDVAQEAINELENSQEGGNSNEEVKEVKTRGRKKKTVN